MTQLTLFVLLIKDDLIAKNGRYAPPRHEARHQQIADCRQGAKGFLHSFSLFASFSIFHPHTPIVSISLFAIGLDFSGMICLSLHLSVAITLLLCPLLYCRCGLCVHGTSHSHGWIHPGIVIKTR